MFREILKSKLHQVAVTEANKDYNGSIALDADWIEEARLMIGEKVQVVNMRTGDRFETYVIEAPAGSKQVGLNGVAAMLGKPGDRVLVMSYGMMHDDEARDYEPVILIFGEDNEISRKIG